MSSIERVQEAYDRDSPESVCGHIPYARFLGLSTYATEAKHLQCCMHFSSPLLGDPGMGALHGGALGGLLESSALLHCMWELAARRELSRHPQVVSVTVEYLRSAKAHDTFASATFIKLGRRVANLRVTAWQSDPAKPVATATVVLLR